MCHSGRDGCVPRNFGQGSVVCECNSTYCDSPGVIKLPPAGQFWSFTTNKAGKRFEKLLGQVQNATTGAGEWATLLTVLIGGCFFCPPFDI